ncbi:MAG: hypothetical protein HY865_14095 [Chloroflexi bacterium]|nr:hypothetical protein [Chloroflexota bacterium]
MTTYSDEQLEISSNHLIYHIKMYVETFLWLQDHPKPTDWDTVRNAILEDHLVHSRVLIYFMQHDSSSRKDDVFAVDYFHDSHSDFLLAKSEFLEDQARKIGGQLVHLTTKSQLLKSEQEWQIGKVAATLVPAMQEFLSVVPNHRISMKTKEECKALIQKISSKPSTSINQYSTSPST